MSYSFNDLQRINFWERLSSFVSEVRVNDPMSEEEKEMIMRVAKANAKKQDSITLKSDGKNFTDLDDLYSYSKKKNEE